MSDDIRLSKVKILFQQNKYAEAEKVLRDLLAQDAHNTHFLALLAEVNLKLGKTDVAEKVIENAIGLAPDAPGLFYIRSRVAIQQDNYNDAEKYIAQAISLDPYDADYFALSANIKLSRKKYEEALETADRALEIDPENLLALNTRSTTLNKLNRSEESFQTIEGALREDPNNPYTHANYGWGLLEKGNHKKAMEHFREALKNDPNYAYAQAGMLQALKASNPVYRLFLKYAFWMSNLTAKYQWGVIIGFFLAFRGLRALAASNKSLEPYLMPVLITLGVIMFSTWIITPVSNLFLRFNKYGQLLLSKKEKMSSNLVALSLVVFLAGLGLYLALSDERYLVIAIFGFTMLPPLSVMFSPSKYKNSLLFYTIALAVTGLTGIALAFAGNELFNIVSTVYIIGFVAFQWIANFLLIREDNR
jgi:Tfp pilus assembly protein PilF